MLIAMHSFCKSLTRSRLYLVLQKIIGSILQITGEITVGNDFDMMLRPYAG